MRPGGPIWGLYYPSFFIIIIEERLDAYQTRVDQVQGELLGLQAAADQLTKKLTKIQTERIEDRTQMCGLATRHEVLIKKIKNANPNVADKILLEN